MIDKAPILITGAARSGAGMIAGVINKCGAFGGTMTNKKGLFENDRIRESIVKPFFERAGVDARGQYPLPKIDEYFMQPTVWREQVQKTMIDEGYDRGAWMYKDARTALIWPVWHYAFPDAKWIIVRRRTGDIIQSCVKTGYMQAFKAMESRKSINVLKEEEGWLWWVHQYEKRFVEMITEGVNCKIIWPERMIHGDYQQLYETLEWLGLPWNTEAVTFIDPLLWSSRKKERRI
jgi:hypothetical protein